jgi:hypothetical protein
MIFKNNLSTTSVGARVGRGKTLTLGGKYAYVSARVVGEKVHSRGASGFSRQRKKYNKINKKQKNSR